MKNRLQKLMRNSIPRQTEELLKANAHEIKELKEYIRNTEYFTKLGVRSAQQHLNGYKMVQNYNLRGSSMRYTLHAIVQIFKQQKTDQEKVLAAFKKADEIMMCALFPSTVQPKMLIKDLAKVTIISPECGSLKPFGWVSPWTKEEQTIQ